MDHQIDVDMRNIPENISNEDLIRRQRDKIQGLRHQIELLKMSNKNSTQMNSRLLEFMKRNDLFELYHKQNDDLNK